MKILGGDAELDRFDGKLSSERAKAAELFRFQETRRERSQVGHKCSAAGDGADNTLAFQFSVGARHCVGIDAKLRRGPPG